MLETEDWVEINKKEHEDRVEINKKQKIWS